jgi:hypothetical protein
MSVKANKSKKTTTTKTTPPKTVVVKQPSDKLAAAQKAMDKAQEAYETQSAGLKSAIANGTSKAALFPMEKAVKIAKLQHKIKKLEYKVARFDVKQEKKQAKKAAAGASSDKA